MIKLDLNAPGTIVQLSIGQGRGETTYRDINDRVAARLAGATQLYGLRIDAPHMPRARQLVDLFEHLPGLREISSKLPRVAVLSDTPPIEFMALMRKQFDQSEVRHFALASTRAADQWLSINPDARPPAAARANVEVDAEDHTNADDGVVVLDEQDASADTEIDDWFVKN